MAKKTTNNVFYKDEITLRDEILELKCQVMALKKTNEHNLLKLRKYQSDAIRKDKHLEQMMDPKKNSNITKVLSTKGAAILLSLKDQNDALIQMILNKDHHIQKLTSEIKMSKLYASTKKNETYGAEINRLKNLITKSQEMLRKNVEFHNQTKLINVEEIPLLEFTPFSNQSSPRDLEELRTTISTLESHIKQSNDLLTQKNEDIICLTKELNFLRKMIYIKAFKATTHNGDETQKLINPGNLRNHKKLNVRNTQTEEFFSKNDKNEKYSKNTLNSIHEPQFNSTTKNNFSSFLWTEERENKTKEKLENAATVSVLQKDTSGTLFHTSAINKIQKIEEILIKPKTYYYKEKWRKALRTYAERKLTADTLANNSLNTEHSKTNNENQNKEINNPENLIKTLETAATETPHEVSKKQVYTKDLSTCETTDYVVLVHHQSEGITNSYSFLQDNKSEITKDNQEDININESHISKSPQHLQNFQIINHENSKCLREISQQNLNFCYDSESSCSINVEIQEMQVEVQINSASLESDEEQQQSSKNLETYETHRKQDKNLYFNDDDDDNDVIFCEGIQTNF